jgi:phage-related protein
MTNQPIDTIEERIRAVIDRWHTPKWKDAEPTAIVMNALEAALSLIPAVREQIGRGVAGDVAKIEQALTKLTNKLNPEFDGYEIKLGMDAVETLRALPVSGEPQPAPDDRLAQVMIGGNHLASAMQRIGFFPNEVESYDEALNVIGQNFADMWIAWKAIMDLLDAIKPQASGEGSRG